MADLNDDQWFDALSGREVKDMNPASLEEMRLIRQVLLEDDGDRKQDANGDEHAYQRLLFKMRREGLLKTSAQEATGTPRRDKPPSLWRRFSLPLSAAATLLLGTTLFMLSSHQDEYGGDGQGPGFEMRDDGHGVPQAVFVENVDETVKSLSRLFEQAGIPYEVYRLGLKVGIEARLPVPVSPALTMELKTLGIKPPADGNLVLEVQDKQL
jgi:hypothetical protein